jgi:hypothetical protein
MIGFCATKLRLVFNLAPVQQLTSRIIALKRLPEPLRGRGPELF